MQLTRIIVVAKNIKTLQLYLKNNKIFQNGLSSNSGQKQIKMSTLDNIPKVDIDPSGVFKYILIKVYDDSNKSEEGPNITIVRGYKRCNYHSDIYDEVSPKLLPFETEPLGGGRISHDADNKKIHIYGYSQGYGKADHEVTAKLIKDAYPNYAISISDEGY